MSLSGNSFHYFQSNQIASLFVRMNQIRKIFRVVGRIDSQGIIIIHCNYLQLLRQGKSGIGIGLQVYRPGLL